MLAHRVAISTHRGEAEDAPLASWETYLASVESSVEYIELDVRRTACGTLVAHHDPALDEVAGHPLVADLTYPELCRLAGYQVPTVPDLLELIAGRARAHLDVKEIGYERELVTLAHDILGPDGYVVSTLEEETVQAVKDEFPKVPVALSLGRDLAGLSLPHRTKIRLSELRPLRRIRRCGADWVSMHYLLALAGVLRLCARHGYPVMVWTVNHDHLIDRFLLDERVTVLVTDRPRYAATRREIRTPIHDPRDEDGIGQKP